MANKPTVTSTYAQNAANPADIITMADADVAQGWPLTGTPPSRQRFNYMFNYLWNAVRYFCQRGISDYDGAEVYGLGSLAIGPDNLTYVSNAANNSGHAPGSDGNWTRWGFTIAQIVGSQLTQANIATGDASTKVANTAFVSTAVAGLQPAINAETARAEAAEAAILAAIPAPGSRTDVTGVRFFGGVYPNTSGRNMFVSGWGTTNGSGVGKIGCTIFPIAGGSEEIYSNQSTATVNGGANGFAFMVGVGESYQINNAEAVTGLARVVEHIL